MYFAQNSGGMTNAALEVVSVTLENLSDPNYDFASAIEKAYGPDGLGVITVSGIPEWEQLVNRTIPLAHELVTLPEQVLKDLEHEESLYNSGWSFGKEKMGDKPDTKKGSYYFNPLSDDPRPETRRSTLGPPSQ